MAFTLKSFADLGVERELIGDSIDYRIALPEIKDDCEFFYYAKNVINTVSDDFRPINPANLSIRVIGRHSAFFRKYVKELADESLAHFEQYRDNLEYETQNKLRFIRNSCIIAGIATTSYFGYSIDSIENLDGIVNPFHIKLLCAAGSSIFGLTAGLAVGSLIGKTLRGLFEKIAKKSLLEEFPQASRVYDYNKFQLSLKKTSPKKRVYFNFQDFFSGGD